MTLVLKATGATFTDSTLPTLSPLYSNSLMAAWRPKDGNLEDLSGNGYNLLKIGNPQFTELGVVGSEISDRVESSVIPNDSCTLYCVVRKTGTPEQHRKGNLFMGGFYVAGYGQSIYFDALGNLAASHSIIVSSSGVANNKTMSVTQPATNVYESFVVLALVVDSESNQSAMYNLTDGTVDVTQLAVGTTLVGRKQLSDVTPKANFGLIASTNTTNFSGMPVEIAESLVYDKALSKQELDKQYNYTRKYMNSLGYQV